jgi:hypothetical protein
MNYSDVKFDKLQKYVTGDLITFHWQAPNRLGIVIEENDDVYRVWSTVAGGLALVIDCWLIEKLILSPCQKVKH